LKEAMEEILIAELRFALEEVGDALETTAFLDQTEHLSLASQQAELDEPQGHQIV
jgi:hypothetical protein